MTLGTIMAKKRLTNENLRGIFKNNFELTNEAIKYAREHINDGHEKNLDELLAEITKHVQKGKDQPNDEE